jgi:hypothetical protein
LSGFFGHGPVCDLHKITVIVTIQRTVHTAAHSALHESE